MKDVTLRGAVYFTAGARRYDATARTLHWLTAMVIFAVVPLGWIFAEFKKPLGGAALYASLHKTLGLIVLALIVARLVWRVIHQPPALPARQAEWEKVAAVASHWLLYFIFIAMPLSGYIDSSASTHPISVLGFFDVPKIPVSHAVGEAAEQVHVLGQFAVYLLVILHIGATAWHLLVRRDAILDRMLPRQTNAD
ncbi:MAG: cytochrome b [Beijerinckiaceae bacterium]|nr:cytochrome b [Beijerinckiaceae bacterium]